MWDGMFSAFFEAKSQNKKSGGIKFQQRLLKIDFGKFVVDKIRFFV
jgi:hypothetical protein